MYTDYVYMGCNNATTDLILNQTMFQLRFLHELLIEYSIHIPISMLQSKVWLMTHETHAHPMSYVRYSHGIWPATWSQTTTTTQQPNTLLPFHLLSFYFLYFPETSGRKLEYALSRSLTAVNYVSLSQNAAKTQHGVSKAYACVQ